MINNDENLYPIQEKVRYAEKRNVTSSLTQTNKIGVLVPNEGLPEDYKANIVN